MIYIPFNAIWPQSELKKKISPDPDGAAKARVSARVTHTPSPISAPIFNPVFTGQVSLRFPSTFNRYFTPTFSSIMCIASMLPLLTATFMHNFCSPHIFKHLAFNWFLPLMTWVFRVLFHWFHWLFGYSDYSSFSLIMCLTFCHLWSSFSASMIVSPKTKNFFCPSSYLFIGEWQGAVWKLKVCVSCKSSNRF